MKTNHFQAAAEQMERIAEQEASAKAKGEALRELISLLDESLTLCEEAHLEGHRFVSPLLADNTKETLKVVNQTMQEYDVEWTIGKKKVSGYEAAVSSINRPDCLITVTITFIFSAQKALFDQVAPGKKRQTALAS